MTPREIIDELGEALGICDQTILLRRINRAVELMASKKLVNTLVGYLNFNVNAGNFIALPREVRSVIAVNVNNSPAFARNRFYEFDLNTPGTVVGDSVEYEWNDRCNVVVQNEVVLPGVLTYRCGSAEDNGKTVFVEGRGPDGRIITETLAADSASPVASTQTFHEVTRILRDATGSECFLYSNGDLCAQYYGDETSPVYRSIRLSKSVASARIMFRREPLKITTLDSFIPLSSPMAVIQAAKAVGHLTLDEDDKADLCLARAEKFLLEDQSSREENDNTSDSRQQVGTLGTGLNNSEGISVLDVYDTACEIFGKMGQKPIFKKISQACQVLCNKAHWDGMLGMVDLWPVSNREDVNRVGGHGHGYYTLPRFVGAPLKINLCSQPMEARNQWYDFHLNGTGEQNLASFDKWDDLGETPLMTWLPKNIGDGTTIPTKVIAVCDNALDVGKVVRIFGMEKLGNEVVEVWRDGVKGWICPCVSVLGDPGNDAPAWVQIDRIERAETRGFVRLWEIKSTLIPAVPETDVTAWPTNYIVVAAWTGTKQTLRLYCTQTNIPVPNPPVDFYADTGRTIFLGEAAGTPVANFSFTLNGSTYAGYLTRQFGGSSQFTVTRTYTPGVAAYWSLATGRLLGMWYPDEVEPKYRLIRLPTSHPKRIRVLYRTRLDRITSIFQPIPLRSTLAVENMLRAIKAQELGLVEQSEPLEMKAMQYLSEDRIKAGQSEMPTLQFDKCTAPGGWENIT